MDLNYQPKVEKLSIQRILNEEGVSHAPLSLSELNSESIREPFGLISVVSSKIVKNWKSVADSAMYYLSDLKGNTATLLLKSAAMRVISEDTCEGTVILIIKPVLAIDAGGKLEILVQNQKQLLVIGNIKSFGRCNALKKDGVTFCKMPVDKSHCEHCVYHNYDSKDGVKKWSPPVMSLTSKLNLPTSTSSLTSNSNNTNSTIVVNAAHPLSQYNSTINNTNNTTTSITTSQPNAVSDPTSEYKRVNVSLPSSLVHHGNICNQV
jgi:hypothetical protein